MTKGNLSQCVKGGDANQRPGYVIGFRYNQDVVEALKTAIPHTYREWRPDAGVWWVAQEYEHVLNELFGNFDALAHLQGSLL